jgi:tetratricopeptide (TPR) repeat protein
MKSRTAEKNSEQLKQLFGKNPDSLLFSRIADLYRKEGNINRAIELCQKGLEAHPEYVTGRIILGRCYIEKENYDNAINEFVSVCKLDRKNLVAIKMLADVFVKQGETGKAGDLYRILMLLDPFDPSFKILASRFDTTGKKELLDILGVQSVADTGFSRAPSTGGAQKFSEEIFENPVVTNQSATGEDNFGANSVDQMLSSFAEEEPVSGNDTGFGMKGSDIDDRMNTLFGEQEQSPSPSLLNDITEEHPLAPDVTTLAQDGSSSGQPVSGSDISDRIDELFDSSGSDSSEIPTGPRGGITEKFYLDKDFASGLNGPHTDQLSEDDINLSGQDAALSENSFVTDDTNAHGEEVLTDAFSDNTIPSSNGNIINDLVSDEFEETLQFDRSMFSRLNDEPDYEELVSSSPFMSMGKTDELFQDQQEEPEDSIDNVSEPINTTAPSGVVTGDTVFHGVEQIDGEHAEENTIDDEDNRPGFISGDQLSDQLDSLFGDNIQGTSENLEQPQIEMSGFSIVEDSESAGLDEMRIDENASENPEFDTPDLLSEFSVEGIDIQDDNKVDYKLKLNNSDDENVLDIDSEENILDVDSGENGLDIDSIEEIVPQNGNESTADSLELINDSAVNSDDEIFLQPIGPIQPIQSEIDEESARQAVTVEDIPHEFDIFDDLSATLETIRKSDYDKMRSQDQVQGPYDETGEKPDIIDTSESMVGTDAGQDIVLLESDAEINTNLDITEDVSPSQLITEQLVEEELLQGDDQTLLIDNNADDIIIDNDDGVVSDMDVLVVSPEDEQMTGDDVVEKIQDIFDLAESRVENPVTVDESSFELVEDCDDGTKEDCILPGHSSIVELPEEEPVKEENEFTGIVSGFINDQEPDKLMSETLVVDAEAEETMILSQESPEKSSGISGSDVEERLEEFFGKDIISDMSMNKLVPEDDESEETLIQDFYTLSGENTATAAGNENLDGVDNVEIDYTVDFIEETANPETSTPDETTEKSEPEVLPELLDENTGFTGHITSEDHSGEVSEMTDSLTIDGPVDVVADRFSAADLFENASTGLDVPDVTKKLPQTSINQLQTADLELDQQDTPYNIPDHVLTPTLADIYFQQGQLQLALQIYTRLLEKDPDNDKIQGRILEIKTSMEQNHEESLTNQNCQHEKVDKKARVRAFPKENSPTTDPRPLAGVRISKKKKAIRRDQKKKE